MIRVTEPFSGYSRPAHHVASKLTPAQRDEIAYRRGDGESCRTIAADYGVSTKTVERIATRERP